MSMTIKVIPTLDSRSVDVSEFEHVPLLEGAFVVHEQTPAPQRCFGGAWYHKVMSAEAPWQGIEGTLTLGAFTPDENRFNLDGKHRYMDNPSVYMGGNAHFESDAGLGMNIGYTSRDTSAPLDYGSKKVAWRPFWRYIYRDVIDHEGNVLRRQFNSWNVADPKNFHYYYFPGDTLRMKVYSPIPHYMQLVIQVITPTTLEPYVSQRLAYGLKDNRPSDFYSPLFHSEGQGTGIPAHFKRVNSIDQYGNEGKVAHATEATVSEAIWHDVSLYRRIDGRLVKVPFTKDRRATMSCPDARAFTSDTSGLEARGGERIAIHPIRCMKENAR